MSGPLTKGALVAYPPTAGAPNPIVTAFQFNPEKMVHTWSQEAPAGKPGVEAGNPMAVAGMPGETFQFRILLDADDDVVGPSGPARPGRAGSRRVRPPGGTGDAAVPRRECPGTAVGTVSAATTCSPSSGTAARTWAVPNSIVPIVLFVWGPKRVVPVRVTTLTITETLYDAQLNPTHAEADIALRVLTPAELVAARPDAGTPAETAQVAYEQMLDRRRQWAATDAANAPTSIIGMLPQ